ncbi:TPA: hypothetical protein ACHHCQ_002381 [Staphylococcus aureus]|uniref:hypothetical protein n=1 Tax=Staphylococcus aureus TaxID=1280 RepID=UPI0024BB5127|nr:hypothetical protein [Staphylococcus aureus]WRN44037.1 hypothetical protein UM859_13485 [Staphylococcus aureus]HDG5969419.1 hypothetical protein [Staphylococcus aureus]
MLLILELRFWNSEFGFRNSTFGIQNYNEWKILIIACLMTWFCSDFYLMNCFLFDVGMLLLMVCHL